MTEPALPSTAAIVRAFRGPPAPPGPGKTGPTVAGILDLAAALHRNNVDQWEREDDARRDDADDHRGAGAKRDIDRMNGVRHSYIEAIDRAILDVTGSRAAAPLATESPGMVIDRLSVMVIRLDSTEARAAADTGDARVFAGRLPRLRSQLAALEEATATLLDDLATGTRRFFAYESFKLYGTENSGPGGPPSPTAPSEVGTRRG